MNSSIRRLGFIWFLLAAASTFCAAEATAEFPSELRLTSGLVLKKCTVVRWTSDSVVVRHQGGVDPIRFDRIASEQRAAVEEVRKAAQKPVAAPITPAAAENNTTIEGQAFIVTRGAGNYKLGDMRVRAFPIEVWGGDTHSWNLGKPLAVATTDAEGKFRIKVPAGKEFFLYARGSRMAGGEHENYQWLLRSDKITDRAAVALTNSNMDLRNVSIDFED